MHLEIHHSLLAVAYAQALFDLARDANQLDAIDGELAAIGGIIADLPKLGQIINDPAISIQERQALIKTAFKGRVSELMDKFLGLLNRRSRLNLFADIAGAFATLLDQHRGKINVDITVAAALGDEQLAAIRQSVSAALKRDAVVNQQVDESIIGGLILRVQDQLIDGSVKTQLAAMKAHLLAGRPVA